ncbi:hypothetical protein [Bacteroides ndongoniae]|uniref:hypothetical protein n=1 Tax=Bacteroides ndongoniae TaxID=1903262 RepID=UPI0008D9C926|nr:hypothetical protein [Bacteroides ndongoniae]
MNRSFIYLFFLLFLYGCQSVKKREVVREKATAQILHNDIMTRMPGTMIIVGNYVVWEDPFARDYFVNVHDAVTGKLVGKMGKVGEGPNEFVTGSLSSHCVGNRLFVSDLNGKSKGYLSIDSLVAGMEPFSPLSSLEKENRPSMIELQHDVFVQQTADGDENYFNARIYGREKKFGVYPVKDVREHLGMTLVYDSISGMLACSSFHIPYLALYQKENDNFKLCWEKEADTGYEVSRGRIVPDARIGGIFGLSICKDYIVSLHRDWENEPLDAPIRGRDERLLPHLVYLYDYDSSLVKVVDLGMPVVRIASDTRTNTLYALVLNPDYMLVKYEL